MTFSRMCVILWEPCKYTCVYVSVCLKKNFQVRDGNACMSVCTYMYSCLFVYIVVFSWTIIVKLIVFQEERTFKHLLFCKNFHKTCYFVGIFFFLFSYQLLTISYHCNKPETPISKNHLMNYKNEKQECKKKKYIT